MRSQYLSLFVVHPDFRGDELALGEAGGKSWLSCLFSDRRCSSSCIRSLRDFTGEGSLLTPPLKKIPKHLRAALNFVCERSDFPFNSAFPFLLKRTETDLSIHNERKITLYQLLNYLFLRRASMTNLTPYTCE